MEEKNNNKKRRKRRKYTKRDRNSFGKVGNETVEDLLRAENPSGAWAEERVALDEIECLLARVVTQKKLKVLRKERALLEQAAREVKEHGGTVAFALWDMLQRFKEDPNRREELHICRKLLRNEGPAEYKLLEERE
jgi:tRNA G18 (ribose-2'-O)-methylase SpoU